MNDAEKLKLVRKYYAPIKLDREEISSLWRYGAVGPIEIKLGGNGLFYVNGQCEGNSAGAVQKYAELIGAGFNLLE